MNINYLLVLASITLSGCSTVNVQRKVVSRQSYAGVLLANLDAIETAANNKRFQEQARKTAELFVSYARVGNLEEMLKLASPLTLEVNGRATVVKNYSENLIPFFHEATVTWNPGGIPNAERGFPGYEISGTANAKRLLPFYIYVFRENGRFLIGTVSNKPIRD